MSGQQSTPLFEYLSDDDGLPQNHVFHVTQDTDGFMWFSTMGGLSKYDGFNFTNYYHREGDSTTLTSSYINAFFQDSKGRCWVVTPNGFNAWDRRTGKAKRFNHDPLNPKSLGHNHTRAILEDKEGYLWIVRQKGIDRFDPSTFEFEHFEHAQYGVARHAGSLSMDSKGNIWALGTQGLFKINREKQKLEFIKDLPPSTNYPPHEGRDLLIDGKDRFWI
jgi:ligand-binding sensor domain-containing protein